MESNFQLIHAPARLGRPLQNVSIEEVNKNSRIGGVEDADDI